MKKSPATERPATRRTFLKKAGTFGAVLPAAALVASAIPAQAAPPFNPNLVTDSDVAVLKFLAALELIEEDLWQQYSEVAVDNVKFKTALYEIDSGLVRHITQDRDAERSHATFINAFLVSIGEQPVNLDTFRTLPSVPVQGARSVGRLTNLRTITLINNWFFGYRSGNNPDLGDQTQELGIPENPGRIINRPMIPTSNAMTPAQVQIIVRDALLHFCTIEQGGCSLYLSLIPKVTHLDVLSILTSIAPTEFYHFTVFHKALAKIIYGNYEGPKHPGNYGYSIRYGESIFPAPASFLDKSLPMCSVVRPSSPALVGPVATTTALINTGLFAGQSAQFFNTITALAQAAGAATRSF